MILDVVTIFSQLIRAALLPHTLDRQSPHRAQFGLWGPFSGTFSDNGIFPHFQLELSHRFYFNLIDLQLCYF